MELLDVVAFFVGTLTGTFVVGATTLTMMVLNPVTE
jgi:hypothetical protein